MKRDVAAFAVRMRWKLALLAGAAAVPFAAWFLYATALHPLHLHPWISTDPFRATWGFVFRPTSSPFPKPIAFAVRSLDLAALAGLVAAIAVAARDAARRMRIRSG